VCARKSSLPYTLWGRKWLQFFLRLSREAQLALRPAGRRNPRPFVGAYFIGSSWRQDLVSSRANVEVNLSDLLVFEQLVPRLHALVGNAVANGLEELCRRQLKVGIRQVRRVGGADRVYAVTPVTVHVPPLPAVVHVVVGVRRRL